MDLQIVFTDAVGLHQQGRLQEALDKYLLILNSLPDNVNLLGNVGIVCRDLGRFDEALEYCLRAARNAPDDPNQLINLGAVYESLTMTEKAVEAYEQAQKLAPEHPKVLNNLGKLYHLLGQTDRGLAMIRRALEREPFNPLVLNNIGVILSDCGDTAGATSFIERSLQLDPTNIEMLYNLSGLYNCLGDTARARQVLEKLLALQPGHESARHMLSALDGSTSETAPSQYVTETFDKYAHRFEAHTQSSLGYTVPSRLAELLAPFCQTTPFARCLDLGCGTGLVGTALQGNVKHLTGIDLSPQMLAVAARKDLYDELVCEELCTFLERTDHRFDLFVAADVFIYVGDLKRFFAGLARTAANGAVLACSIERLASDGQGYVLRSSGRFAHAPDYLHNQATNVGFTLREHRRHDIRKENGVWIPGDLFIFTRHTD